MSTLNSEEQVKKYHAFLHEEMGECLEFFYTYSITNIVEEASYWQSKYYKLFQRMNEVKCFDEEWSTLYKEIKENPQGKNDILVKIKKMGERNNANIKV